MFSVVMLIVALAIYLVAGLTVLILMDKEKLLQDKLLLRLALSFMLGIGLVSTQMFMYSLLSIKFGFIVVALPWLLLLAVLIYYDFNSARECFPINSITLAKFTWVEKTVIGFLLFEFVYLFAFSLYSHPVAWDAQHIWFLKAKAFFISGSVDRSFFLNELYFDSRPDYPLMVPLSITWLYTAIGYVDDRIVKVLYPIQYLSLIVIFFYMVKFSINRVYAFVFTLILSIIPVLQIHSGGFPESVGGLYVGDFVGYADLTLSICFVSVAGWMFLYIKNKNSLFLLLIVSFLSMAGWAKNEGMVFMLVGFLILSLFVYFFDKNKIKYFLISLLIPAFVVMPWFFYSSFMGVDSGGVFALESRTFISSFFRAFTIGYNIIKFSLNIELLGVVGVIFYIVILLDIKQNIKMPIIFLYGLFVLQAGAYGAAYFFTTLDLATHISTSVDRILFHLAPLALFIIAISTYNFFNSNIDDYYINDKA